MRSCIVSLCTSGLCACAAFSASGAAMGFEDLSPTTKVYPFGFGSSFVSSGMTVSVSQLIPGKNGGIEADDAIITLGTTNFAGMSGNALSLKKAIATFEIGVDVVGVDFYFGEFGKTLLFDINGASLQTKNPATLPTSLGGATISYTQLGVSPDGKGSLSHISISGPINSFSLGGDKFWIDDISFTVIPAPGAAGVLMIGGLLAARRRR
jgi:hypothetical protein